MCCAVLSLFSRVWLCATPLTVACRAPLSMGFSTQEHWLGLPGPPPGDLPSTGILSARFSYVSVGRKHSWCKKEIFLGFAKLAWNQVILKEQSYPLFWKGQNSHIQRFLGLCSHNRSKHWRPKRPSQDQLSILYFLENLNSGMWRGARSLRALEAGEVKMKEWGSWIYLTYNGVS